MQSIEDSNARTLREDARVQWSRYEQGECTWGHALAAVCAADQAREELTSDERAVHDRWLFAEPMSRLARAA